MTTDYHALITKMAAELSLCQQLLLDDRRQRHPLADHARAALAESDGPAVPDGREPASVAMQPTEPEAEGPTDEALDELFTEIDQGGEALSWRAYARAALARWGHQPAPPAAGEVAELLEELRSTASGLESQSYPQTAALITRAADLLEQRHPAPVPVLPDDALIIEPAEHTLLVPVAQPVPVSERLPEPGDCDAEGRCWLGGYQMGSGTPTWLLGYPAWAERFPNVHRFWLPAHALPTPEATDD